ncbi:unnamed protein product [Zymoseptoria tritici ST99CH_3D1]|nr:unnamed protein product [Zymoseptoria tritici ST99CH_3D1]
MGANKETFAKETQLPEWEHVAAAGGTDGKVTHNTLPPRGGSKRAMASAKLDSVMPPHRKYVHLSRKTFLIALGVALLALLVLIIGLAAGLSSGSSYKNLPLPSNHETFTGEITYFATGLGACGETNKDGDKIVAVSQILFDKAGSSSSKGGNSNSNPLCGKMLRATVFDQDRGQQRSVDLRVVDRCTGCDPTDLDVTEDVFKGLASVDRGRVEVKWAWLQ